jgi:hypothetical protein
MPTARRIKFPAFSDLSLFTRILLFAASVPLLMRLKLTRLAALLEPGSAAGPLDPTHANKICSYTEKAIRLGSPIVRRGCLTLGLTRYYFLRRAGMDVSLHFGVGRVGENESFDGHCWLARDGEPYYETRDPRPLYVEMWRISPKAIRSSIPVEENGIRRLRNV